MLARENYFSTETPVKIQRGKKRERNTIKKIKMQEILLSHNNSVLFRKSTEPSKVQRDL